MSKKSNWQDVTFVKLSLTEFRIPEIKWHRRTVARSNRVDQPLSELRIFAEKASDSLEGNSKCTWSNQKLKQMCNHPKNSTAVMQNVWFIFIGTT